MIFLVVAIFLVGIDLETQCGLQRRSMADISECRGCRKPSETEQTKIGGGAEWSHFSVFFYVVAVSFDEKIDGRNTPFAVR